MPIVVSRDVENELRASMLSGSKIAFERLYHTYGAQLMGYILKVAPDKKAAEEILQKTFVEIWNSKHEYDASGQSLFIWMLHIAKKTTLQFVGKGHNSEIRNTSSFVHINNALNEKEQVVNSEKLQRAIFELLHYNNCSIKELAGLLNVDEYKIKEMLHSAVKNLKNPAL
jgi:RNA polymerase sigma-70 factor (ECF subfamily)